MSDENIIFAGVALYMLGMLGVGYYASTKARSVADFMVAGRGLSLPVCSMTVMATWFGGAMMLGGAGAAYDHGMLGVIADPQWDGSGLGPVEMALVVEELARGDGGLALTVASHNTLCTEHIGRFGSEAQKEKYIGPLARGEKLGAWAITEADSGR